MCFERRLLSFVDDFLKASERILGPLLLLPAFWNEVEELEFCRDRNRPNQEILVPDWLITSHVI